MKNMKKILLICFLLTSNLLLTNTNVFASFTDDTDTALIKAVKEAAQDTDEYFTLEFEQISKDGMNAYINNSSELQLETGDTFLIKDGKIDIRDKYGRIVRNDDETILKKYVHVGLLGIGILWGITQGTVYGAAASAGFTYILSLQF